MTNHHSTLQHIFRHSAYRVRAKFANLEIPDNLGYAIPHSEDVILSCRQHAIAAVVQSDTRTVTTVHRDVQETTVANCNQKSWYALCDDDWFCDANKSVQVVQAMHAVCLGLQYLAFATAQDQQLFLLMWHESFEVCHDQDVV